MTIPPYARLSGYYFSLMTVSAVATPLLAIYLDGKGLTESQIAQVNALPLAVMLTINLVIGRLADRAQRWKLTILCGTGLGFLAPMLLPAAESWLALALVWVLVLSPVNLMVPISDAASVRYVKLRGGSFSHIRLWATIGHMSVTVAASWSYGFWGIGVFVPLLIGLGLLRFAGAALLPEFKVEPRLIADARAPLPSSRATGGLEAQRFGQLFRPWFILPALASALLNASHFALNALGTLFWADAGFTGWQIGLFWFIAGASEVAVMAVFPRLMARLSARALLIAASAAVALRWTLLAFDPSLPLVVGAQMLHGVTFGISYLAAVAFIARWSGDALAAQSQSLLSVLRQGTAFLALLGFGYGAEAIGPRVYLYAAALGLAAAGFCLLSLRQMPTHRLKAGR
ncbi:MFS transporter [Pseudoroseicyclus sp. H15]